MVGGAIASLASLATSQGLLKYRYIPRTVYRSLTDACFYIHIILWERRRNLRTEKSLPG